MARGHIGKQAREEDMIKVPHLYSSRESTPSHLMAISQDTPQELLEGMNLQSWKELLKHLEKHTPVKTKILH